MQKNIWKGDFALCYVGFNLYIHMFEVLFIAFSMSGNIELKKLKALLLIKS